jgi:hypothetical protein
MALFLFALFLAWTPFDFWTGLPDVLHFVQFNYRFLTQVMWLGALLSSFGLAQLFLNQLDRRHVLVGIFMIGIASSSYLITHEPLPDIISEQAKRPGIDIPGDYLFDQELLKTELFGKNQMQLVSLENTLVLNKEIQFPNWTAEENPVVSIKGSNINTIPILLSFMINNQEFQSHRFEPGDFTWDIPLKSSAVSGNSFGMKFEIKPFNKDAHFGENPRVKIKTITISGMSPDKTVIPYGILKKNMQNVGEPSNFNITVGNDAHVVQLPALYLPDFISVLVNGKNQAYFGVPLAQYTLVGVRLDPGNYNIQVLFSGLGWANCLSYFSWIALILVSFFVFRRQTIALQTIRNE